ncbi:crotonase/enoyl-CoA hydratase family protein [Desulfothermus okinawensis JCM 13304]
MEFKFFNLEKDQGILKISFKNNEKYNAMRMDFFEELPDVVKYAEEDKEVVVVVFYSTGKHFSVGLDVFDFANKYPDLIDTSRKSARTKLYKLIKEMQLGMDLIFEGRKIYIAAVHGYCIGGALDLIAACDLRFASQDAIFSLRETKLGIVADLGSLQRLPYIIGIGNTKYLAYTGMDIGAQKAKEINLINEIFENKEELLDSSLKIARQICENPKDAVFGSKKFINNHCKEVVARELDRIATYNSSFLDFMEIAKLMEKSLKK